MFLSVDNVNIQFEWPASRESIILARHLTADDAVVFDVVEGDFGVHSGHLGHDTVVFYWYSVRPVMMNLCADHVCYLDGAAIAYGGVHPLRESSKIQAGHFKLAIVRGDTHEFDGPSHYQLIYPDDVREATSKIPEVDDILPNGGNYINDLRYFEDVILAQDTGDDLLKTLKVEYQRFLIWQEQEGGHFTGMPQQANHIIKMDHRFEQIREQIKDKTLTECVIARAFLMEKVWPELLQGEEWSELFAKEEKIDLLRALSPEHIVAKNKSSVPELVFKDFCKVGLDSHY